MALSLALVVDVSSWLPVFKIGVIKTVSSEATTLPSECVVLKVKERGVLEIPMSKIVAKSPLLSGIIFETTFPSIMISKLSPAKPFPTIVAEPDWSILNKSNFGDGIFLSSIIAFSDGSFVSAFSASSDLVASSLFFDSSVLVIWSSVFSTALSDVVLEVITGSFR